MKDRTKGAVWWVLTPVGFYQSLSLCKVTDPDASWPLLAKLFLSSGLFCVSLNTEIKCWKKNITNINILILTVQLIACDWQIAVQTLWRATSETVQKHAGINPKQASTRAVATSSGSRVWTRTCRTLVTSRAPVNAIIPSSVLLVWTWINMTEHLMPRVIAQCFNRGNTSTKRK